MSSDFNIVGKETPRIDGVERVTGQSHYTEDIYLPGMLFARVLRSPVPHARVKKVDTAAAEALPGVMSILHADNDITIWNSGDGKGRRRIVADTVRFVGDSVAVVAAVDRHTAEDALQLIQVEYEELPYVLNLEDAIREGAPKIYPEGNIRDGDPSLSERGNLEEGFRQADYIYEQEFITKHHNNAQMERRVSLAQWTGDRLTVWASTQGIYNCRSDIANDLKLPLNKVRVISQYMGGGFGNKNQGYDFDLMAAVLARRTGRPVRLEFTRPEDFISVHGRWATRQHYRIGVKNDGTLRVVDFKGYSDIGAYARGSGGIGGRDCYVIPNLREEVIRVHTNTSCAANYRAPSGPQGAFAFESALDEIADRLKIDPVEMRIK
ncbi:MAG: xanthine dehydrogenase family protein molybdopterin-binding subunit, partial [Acidobacteria bacterium]|nr:xanthine dehydrogenase family protein molybdopterin-binding subunit [Acidobacteriota bacterium]